VGRWGGGGAFARFFFLRVSVISLSLSLRTTSTVSGENCVVCVILAYSIADSSSR
jgi:hypothetical protein